jgi:hypothetical protein
LDCPAILQAYALDGGLLVVWHELAIFGGDAETVNVKVGFSGNALVEVARAALNVNAGLGGQLGDAFAWEW